MNKVILIMIGLLVTGLVGSSVGVSFSDDPYTLGLWNMDMVDNDVVPDLNTFRGNDLLLSSGASISTGEQGVTGEALVLTGLTLSHARVENNWGGAGTFRFEAWIKPTEQKNSTVMYIHNVVQLQINSSGHFFMFGRDPIDGWGNHTRVVALNAITWNAWHHVEMTFDADGWMSLYVDGVLGTSSESLGGNPRRLPSGALNSSSSVINMGGAGSDNPTFVGLLDNVRVALFADAEEFQPKQDDAGTYALYHVDEVAQRDVGGELRDVILDDDSANPGRQRHLVLGKWLDSGWAGMEPDLVDEGVFGKALSFDPDSDHTAWVPGWSGSDYFRFEAWVKPYNVSAASPQPVLLEAASCVRIWYRWGTLRMAVRKPDDSGWSAEYNFPVPEGMWDHIVAEIHPDGTFTLSSLYGHVEGSTGEGSWRSVPLGRIAIGNSSGNLYNNDHYFKGLIDDVKISDGMIACGGLGYPVGDINRDCQVDIEDLMIIAESWLKTTDPTDPDAVNLN